MSTSNTKNTSYKINSHSGLVSCSSYTSYFGLFRDTASKEGWEIFTEDSIKDYFNEGFEKFSIQLKNLRDQKEAFSSEDAATTTFMLESLLHARQIMDSNLGGKER